VGSNPTGAASFAFYPPYIRTRVVYVFRVTHLRKAFKVVFP